MSEQNNPEPTMEEILASIRRIISEDDAPASAPAPASASEPAAHAHEPEPELEAHEDDVLELTDRLESSDPVESLGDLDVFPATPAPAALAPAPPPPRPAPVFQAPPPEPAPASKEEPLVSHPAASSAASAFGHLERSILMPADGRSLEDLVRELLRPLLKSWLEEHLPGIVQASVEAEVERIARQRR
jgi:cell pole-organizing protein PopZ